MELKNGMTVISPKNVKRHNIKKADELLYQAKQNGRNQVISKIE